MSALSHDGKMPLLSRIVSFMNENGGDMSLQQIYEAFKDEKTTTIRGRINEAVTKNRHIIRTAKGHYMLIGAEVEAIVEKSDSRESMFEILKANLYYDLVFFDIPYAAGGQKGGNRNLSNYALISPEEFQIIVSNVEKMLKTDMSQVYFMIAGGKSSSFSVEKYIRAFDATSLKKAGDGNYIKLNSNGTQCNMGKYLMPSEKILVYSASGNLLKPEETILDFELVRPPLPRSGGYPTEKPKKLYEQIFTQGTERGNRILDPFTGGGMSLEVAVSLGRKIHCIDISDIAIEKHVRPKLELLARPPQMQGRQQSLFQF